MIRQATKNDVDAVELIYSHIHDFEEEEKSGIGWLRGVYPVKSTAENAMERQELFVYEEDGQILAAAIINSEQPAPYAHCSWKFPADAENVLVIHTLAVDPTRFAGGVGKKVISFYEEMARKKGFSVLRLDTNAKNLRARRFYARLGYIESGSVQCDFNGCPNIELTLLEKKI